MKYLDPAELRDFGYLQEVNRQFFHPLGLALSVTIEDDGSVQLGPIWDCRDDYEGITYHPSVLASVKAQQNATRVAEERKYKGVVRAIRYEWIVQPIP